MKIDQVSQPVAALHDVANIYFRLSEFVENLEELIEPLTDEQKRFLFKSIVECDAFADTRRQYIATNPSAKKSNIADILNSPHTFIDAGKATKNPPKKSKSTSTPLTTLILNALKNCSDGLNAQGIWEAVKNDYKTTSKNPKPMIYQTNSQLLKKGKIKKDKNGIYSFVKE